MKTAILRRILATLSILVVLQSNPVACQADLIVEVDDAMIAPGETTVIDVFISNVTGGVSNNDIDFNFTQYNFEITGGDGVSQLRFQAFLDFPTDPDFDFVNDPDYIFVGTGGAPFYDGGASSDVLYFGEDEQASGDSTVPIGESRLLVRLEVTHTLGLGQTAANFGATTFSLTAGPGSIFEDFNFNEAPALPALFRTGAISVVSAVPEPSTGIALAIGCCAWIARRRQSRLSA